MLITLYSYFDTVTDVPIPHPLLISTQFLPHPLSLALNTLLSVSMGCAYMLFG